MSNRRKRTAPVRVDEETKKKLSWNMCNDLKDLHPLDRSNDYNNPSAMSSGPPGHRETTLLQPSSLKQDEPFNISAVTQVEDGEGHLLPLSTTTQISLAISPGHLGEEWRALLDGFTLQLPTGQAFPEELWFLSIGLMKTSADDQLQVSIKRKCDDSERDDNKEFISCVRTSLNFKMLENITWLQKKNVIGLFQNTIEDRQTLKIGVYLLESGLGKPEFLSEGSHRMKKTNALMQKLMEYFYDLTVPDVSSITEEADERENIEELYDFVRHAHQQETLYIEKVQHPLLVPTLRSYQCQAVSWMLQREQCSPGSSSSNNALHLLWKEVTTKDEKKIYYNPYTGCIIRERPLLSADWPGGILADEMGLGKTVEMLALILTHTRKEMKQDTLSLPEGTSVNYYIPPPLPAASQKTSRKKAEVKPKEKVNYPIKTESTVYQGVKKHGFIQPHALAKHEIVITTYDVLRSELNYVDIPHSNSDDGRRLRKEKRYMAIPSPLVAVEWWRICLDEAQMVECATAKAAEMCLRLSAINRWCVTGTPVQRSLEDLYGLVLFLGVDPYWVKHWWDQLLYQPYCRKNPIPVYTLIAKIMWRTAKKDVLDQIQIPPQTEEVHWLRFSPVERHFYHRQHEICSQDALQKLRKISDWSTKLSSLDRRTVSSILYPLLRLRQACCHPQAVRGEFLPLQKSTMTMEELLKSLQKKCCTECEEAHRQLVCALNGLAGIHIIRGEFVTAVEYYREVLRSSEEHKGKLQTDSLQRLHATHNLIELLEANHPGIPPTLRDHKLREEAEQLRQHYMNKSDLEVSAARQALPPVQQNIRELQRKIHPGAPWWLGIIECVLQAALDDELVTRVRNEISCNYKQQPNKLSMAEKFHDCRGLQFLLTVQIEELKKSQKMVQDSVKNLEGPPSQEEIRLATVCHLRPVRFPLNNCQFCKADELFTEYESKLFSHSVKGQKAIFEEMIEEDEGLVDERLPTTSRGLRAASETERALKAILAFGKAHRIDTLLIEEGNIFMELFELWKKEYKLLHEYWMALRNRVSAIDELAMATERFQVRLPGEPKPNLPVLHIIESHEVEQNRIKLLNDKAVATSQLQKKLGQVLYLTNLEKSQDPSTGSVNPDPCPICSRQLGQQWAVLTCGHCFCNDCIAIIIEQYSIGARRSAIKCAICRQTTAHKEVSYVFTTEAASKEDEFPVKGSHSTKVEAVLRTLKKIQQKEPEAKALVFSTWQDVLDIIGKALLDNNMEFVQINGLHRFQENLSAFKYDSKINILLLPLHTASNGLNIIEATYVLLVEPILNLAHELQAIGRVHRIGQTKATVVHRFLIKGTIEERMQSMLKSTEKSHNKSMIVQSEASVLTVGDLADLFSEEDRTTDE
ncbi:E3 ubiquitin-protein ligase SHPRH [Rhincodon typus]|uniref:E3 ubiquitin-protein ligase SHPRH n=1 Tax=Rhincodon typus TaxID=259920 RepID=UPI00202DEDD9|nr:E3 ubiquitin-protein ligase SHPRH [Rhincodon typus]